MAAGQVRPGNTEYLPESFYGVSIAGKPPARPAEILESDMEDLLREARRIRDLRFGRRINLYSPLYLSSYCENNCAYCGFSGVLPRSRRVLNRREILAESDYLKSRGIESILIVGGEDPSRSGFDFICGVVEALTEKFSHVSVEVSPFSQKQYRRLYNSGLDGVTVYQETYDRKLYARYHRKGRKTDYRYRLETPERAALVGIPFVNIGALLGLAPWREEVAFLTKHLKYLIKKYWKTTFGVSFPRVIEEGAGFKAPYPVSDRDFVRIVAAVRMLFPDTPIYISTREAPYMRDNLVRYGVTHMSVESKTSPGGYLNYRKDTEQFGVIDSRSTGEVCAALEESGLRPVFKDWDRGYRNAEPEVSAGDLK